MVTNHCNVWIVKLKKSPSKTISAPSKHTTSRQRGGFSTATNPSVSTSSTPTTSKELTQTPHINLSKVSDNSLSKFHHQISVIGDGFHIDSPTEKILYKTMIECHTYLAENFTHLDKTDENIFTCNAHSSIFNSLFMNNLSLERLLHLEGTIRWLGDVMLTFFTTLLNLLFEYNIEKEQLSDVLPSVVFADTKDNVLTLNPCIHNKTFNLLRLDFNDLKHIIKISQRK